MKTDTRQSSDSSKKPNDQDSRVPSINLPKGGGAIRGMGEKFAANPVTGTGSMTVPIATSPGRSGFGPQLSLSYDSGAGNGPFGFGWHLSLPSIIRKTDKGLPRYHDAEESDVFMLSGAEDLVPVYRQDTDGTWVASHPGYQRDADGLWVRDPSGRLVVHEDQIDVYRVRRYRPRIEGLFARIERWTNMATGEIHWHSITRDNVTTLYGKDNNSRIVNPTDPSRPTRRVSSAGSSARATTTRVTPSSTSTRQRTRTTSIPARPMNAIGALGQPLPEAHQVRESRLTAHPAGPFDSKLDVRGGIRLRRGPLRGGRSRPCPTGGAAASVRQGLRVGRWHLGRPSRPVLLPPRRVRGTHLPPLPSHLDVPSHP